LFSLHLDVRNIGRGQCYAQGWKPAHVSLPLAVARFPTSPIVFQNGVRTEKNFLSADWLVLDFDEGPSLASIEKTFCDSVHVIGTTKSHQKPKGHAPPCDRFRVWLRAEHTITNAGDYKETVRLLVRNYDADPACVGAAQLFWPCLAITSVAGEGYTQDVVRAKERPTTQNRPEYNGRIPYWVKNWLKGDFTLDHSKGRGRNWHVLKTAIWLTKNGWDENDIVRVVMSSEIPINQTPEVHAEVIKTVRSGKIRAEAEMGMAKI
jgi:hypothetical protein